MNKLINNLCVPLIILFALQGRAQAPFDSLRLNTRHYFNTVFTVERYGKPERQFADTQQLITRRLKSYGIRQFSLAFYTPLLTIEKDDSLIRRNSHLLLTCNLLSLQPRFSGLKTTHRLVMAGIGLRYIYNNGQKGVWFFDLSPFITADLSYVSKPYYRLASTLVYSHNPSPRFNWRLGLTKSFLWGNRFYLPFVGIRVGELDKIYFSIQFPRSIHLNLPLSHKVILSVYSRGQGGVFNFSNADSLYYKTSEPVFYFSRYEVNTGLRCEVRPGPVFSFFLALGLSSRNQIHFYSESANPRRRVLNYDSYFYSKRVAPGAFTHAGIVLKLGRTRSYYKNRNIYDAIDLNQGHVQIMPDAGKRSLQNIESIQDLIEYNDY